MNWLDVFQKSELLRALGKTVYREIQNDSYWVNHVKGVSTTAQ